jgi:hypothetical protein
MLHQLQRQESILETVYSQGSPGELVLIKEGLNLVVWDIFFLHAYKLFSYVVEFIALRFVLSEEVLHHVKLDSTFDIDLLEFSHVA